jgi:hypothetical protein
MRVLPLTVVKSYLVKVPDFRRDVGPEGFVDVVVEPILVEIAALLPDENVASTVDE